MKKQYWIALAATLIVVLQGSLIWYLFLDTRASRRADARVFAQRQREFDDLVRMHQLDARSVENITEPRSALFLTRYDAGSVGQTSRHDSTLHAVLRRSDRADLEFVLHSEGSVRVTSFDPGLGTLGLEVKQTSDQALLKVNARVMPEPNLAFQTTMTFQSDRQGRISNVSGTMNVGGKSRKCPPVIAPLYFPERELAVGDAWSLKAADNTGRLGAGQAEVRQAVAKLLGFVNYRNSVCAKIGAHVSAVVEPSSVFGGDEGAMASPRRGTSLITEDRIYIIRVKDSEVLWSEIVSDIENVGRLVTRQSLQFEN